MKEKEIDFQKKEIKNNVVKMSLLKTEADKTT